MKIAYVTIGYPSPDQPNQGVFQKIIGQMNAWLKLGHDVRWFALSATHDVPKVLAQIPVTAVYCAPRIQYRFLAFPKLVNKVIEWQPDVVYSRQSPYYAGHDQLMKAIPTVLEINSNDMTEYRETLPRLQFMYHKLTRPRVTKACAGIICVTNELAALTRDWDKPQCVIANGINLDQYPETPAPNNPKPRLVIMVSVAETPWTGYEQVIEIATHFPDWQIEIIGGYPDALVPQLRPNMNRHGFMTKSGYDSILRSCDIGIGSLAAYRKKINEACALKVREYMAYGLPSIIGYQDTDFLTPPPFILQLPNAADSVRENYDKLGRFVNEWRGKRIPRSEVAHLDSGTKEKIRLDFFKDCIS